MYIFNIYNGCTESLHLKYVSKESNYMTGSHISIKLMVNLLDFILNSFFLIPLVLPILFPVQCFREKAVNILYEMIEKLFI